jgi:hypothetical protein
MSSIIKVNTYQDANGNALFSSDGSGNVTTSASGLQNTPSFFAYKTSNQSVSDGVFSKITFQSSVYDTDSAFTTSNKFTVPSGKAGKYCFQSSIRVASDGGTMEYGIIRFYKNGSGVYTSCQIQTASNQMENSHIFGGAIFDLSAGDYIETYVAIGGNNPNVQGSTTTTSTSYFGGYKLIGA